MRKISFIKQSAIVFFLIGCATISVKAQNSIGATANYAIVSDDLAKAAKNGYGVTLHAKHHFDEYLSAGIDVGYVTFENKNTDSKISPLIDGKQLTIIPVTAAFQITFSKEKFKPFFCLDMGWAYANLKLVTGSTNFGMIAPQFGVDYGINDQLIFRLSVKDNILIYNRLVGGTDIMSYVGINLGAYYKF